MQGEIFLQSNSNLSLFIYNVNEIILFHSERTMESLIIHKTINLNKREFIFYIKHNDLCVISVPHTLLHGLCV